MKIEESVFGRWVLEKCRGAGWCTESVGVRGWVIALVVVALERGLTPAEVAEAAQGLGVSTGEVTAAYIGEMRELALNEVLGHPDLAVLDVYLDDVADER